MYSYEQIARWLTFPIDPITVEDWVANREIFGREKGDHSEQTEEIELAYQVEKLRESMGNGEQPPSAQGSGGAEEDLDLFLLLNGVEVVGTIDRKDYLAIVPEGRIPDGRKLAEIKINQLGLKKEEKFNIFFGELFIKELDPTVSYKVQVYPGKVSWTGAGKKVFVFDGRGRPLPDFGPGVKSQEIMKKIKNI